MRLAVLQLVASAGDVARNLAQVETAAARAAAAGADLLVAPELALTGYGAADAIRARADGDAADALAAIATRHGLALVVGCTDADDAGRYNAARLVRPGAADVVYRKLHLYGAHERALFRPGTAAPPVVTVGGLKLGVCICYDVEFPELVRDLARRGAELVVVPTALPAGPDAGFIAERLVPVRGFENQIFVAYADHAGADDVFAYAGRSVVSAPDGAVLARAPVEGEALLVVDIAPARYAASRRANPHVGEARYRVTIF